MLKHFFSLIDPVLTKRVPHKYLVSHLLPYWKQGKRFTRKLWENPDTNDPDMTAAFRKRNEPPKKMETRRNEQTLKQKLYRKRQMKDETVKFVVAKLLPATWEREATKQSLDRVHDAQFDRMYEAMLKEKGLSNNNVPAPLPREKLLPQKLFEFVKVKIALPREE